MSDPVRHQNLLALFSEFVERALAEDPGAPLQGLDKAFSQKLEMNNTYFCGLKSGSRGIGNKLARQIESKCGRAAGWLDTPHEIAVPPKRPRGLDAYLRLAEKAYLAASTEQREVLVRYVRAK